MLDLISISVIITKSTAKHILKKALHKVSTSTFLSLLLPPKNKEKTNCGYPPLQSKRPLLTLN